MSETIKRHQPNSVWDDSWVVDAPETEVVAEETPSAQPRIEAKPEDWS